MKRVIAVALLSLSLGVTACSSEGTNGQSVVADATGGGSGCEGFEDIDNLSAKEMVANLGEWVASEDGFDVSGLAGHMGAEMTGEWAGIIASSPAGGQGQYIFERCDVTSKTTGSDSSEVPGIEAVFLYDGYGICNQIRQFPDLPSSPSTPELEGMPNLRTHELLCPDLPYEPR